jgi:hypothetical protein
VIEAFVEVCRLRVRVERLRWQIASGRRGGDVSRLSEIGDRIAAKKRAHDAKADEWASRLDKIDAKEPEAFAYGDGVVAEREQDLAQFESDMRKLSNLPLGLGSETSEHASPRSTEVAGKLGDNK